MTIEQLIYNIPPEFQVNFLELDAKIWTPYLSSFPFFVGKEVWTNPEDINYLSFVIHWTSLAEWKSIPLDKLMELSQEFDSGSLEKFGQVFGIIESKTFAAND